LALCKDGFNSLNPIGMICCLFSGFFDHGGLL